MEPLRPFSVSRNFKLILKLNRQMLPFALFCRQLKKPLRLRAPVWICVNFGSKMALGVTFRLRGSHSGSVLRQRTKLCREYMTFCSFRPGSATKTRNQVKRDFKSVAPDRVKRRIKLRKKNGNPRNVLTFSIVAGKHGMGISVTVFWSTSRSLCISSCYFNQPTYLCRSLTFFSQKIPW